MRVLELYSGIEWGKNVFKEFGIGAVCISLDMFDYSLFHKNEFDMVVININGNSLRFYDDVGDMELGLDAITYYEPKYWMTVCSNKEVWDDIVVWGLPYKDVCVMRCGKLEDKRIWTNISRWEPELDKIYIKQNCIISELLQYV